MIKSIETDLRHTLAPALIMSAFLMGCDADRQTGPTPDADAEAFAQASGPETVECAPDNGGITLPPGFCAAIVADNVGRARHIAVTPTGDIFVALSGDGGGILALRDVDGDGQADQSARFGDPGTGIAWEPGFLYSAPNDRVVRYQLSHNALVPERAPTVVVSGLPDTGDHPAKAIAIDGGSRLFVNIASASNSCQVEDRVVESPGIDPCPELPVRSGVWLFNANRPNQTQADGERWASGIRNATALGLSPTGTLWGVQHGRDQLFPHWPDFYVAEDDGLLPAEELMRIDRGDTFGWPYCYYDDITFHALVLAPEYGGTNDGTEGRCAELEGPELTFPAHWAPLSLLFYTGQQFPSQYQGGMFVAFHGARFETAIGALTDPGYNVVFVPFAGGAPQGGFETFADGFDGGGLPLPDNAAHRPVGLAQGPDGSLYITDDKGGRIWRVIYTGN